MTLSEYIQRDLKAHLLGGGDLPCKLTLAAISEHYEVSLMPVRTAVDALVRDEFLVKQANGRLTVHPDVGTREEMLAPLPPPQPPKSSDAYEREIMELAVRLSLQGRQQYLREEETATRFGLGRSAVRRIFSRLSGAGILEYVPRCGWRVCSYREEDMRAFIDVREVLEPKALDLARGTFDPADLRAFIEANSPGADDEPRIDNGLHKYWIERCDNRYILDFFRLHGPFYETLVDCATVAEAAVAVLAEQHREILEAILARKWGTAKKALLHHIRAQQPVVFKLFAYYRENPEATEIVVNF